MLVFVFDLLTTHYLRARVYNSLLKLILIWVLVCSVANKWWKTKKR
jgi:hypothetical protein